MLLSCYVYFMQTFTFIVQYFALLCYWLNAHYCLSSEKRDSLCLIPFLNWHAQCFNVQTHIWTCINYKRFIWILHTMVSGIVLSSCCNEREAVWRSRQGVRLVIGPAWVWTQSKSPVVSLSKKLYPHSLVLVSLSNGFELSSKQKLLFLLFWLESAVSE